MIAGLGASVAAAAYATVSHRVGAPPLQLRLNWFRLVGGVARALVLDTIKVGFSLMRAAPGICVSTGSACSSAEIEPSYVLRAMGLDDAAAQRTLRIGIGRFTSAADIDVAAEVLAAAHASVAHARIEA